MWRCRLGVLFALTGLLLWPASAVAESRIALVIGNSAYKTVTALPNPANDAKAMTELLHAAGFDVVSRSDLSQSDMRRALRDFAARVALKGPDTVALVYYAGHGVQIEGENYLIPVDAAIERESDVAIEAVRLADVMSALAETRSRMRIVILDACRNNPFSAISKVTGRGLAIVDAPNGSIVSYATAPGMEALDGAGENSPFTAALVDIAKTPDLPIEQALKQIRLAVHAATQGQQTPWESSSLTGDFAFFGKAKAVTPDDSRRKTGQAWQQELRGKKTEDAFEIVLAEDDIAAYEAFLVAYPNASLAPRVRGLLERRREMMTWYTVVTVNTVLSYEAFLERYPNSDLAATARKLRDRANERSQSANLTRGIPGMAGVLNSAPAATPVSVLPAACSCPTEPKRTEPARPRPSGPPPRRPPLVIEEEVIIRRPPPQYRPPRRPPVIGYPQPSDRRPPSDSCKPGMRCWQQFR